MMRTRIKKKMLKIQKKIQFKQKRKNGGENVEGWTNHKMMKMLKLVNLNKKLKKLKNNPKEKARRI